MKKSAFEYPRTIDPSLVEVGDTIKVTMAKNRGMEISYTGTVHHRGDHGAVRYYYTEEGATLLSWEPDTTKKVHVLLLHRAEAQQTQLSIFAPDNIVKLEERMTG